MRASTFGLVKEVRDRWRFWSTVDRIGPDVPTTHWRLYYPTTMRNLCRARFAHFGEGAEFRPGAYAIACAGISIGSRVVIRPTTMLFADPRTEEATITIEDDVMLGSGVHIYVGNHIFENPLIPIIDQGHSPSDPVVLQRGCWVGANAVILPGVNIIGRNAVVGAGAIVTHDVPPGTVVAGSPARIVKQL